MKEFINTTYGNYLFMRIWHYGNQRNCRSGISRNKEIVESAFNKIGETLTKCSQICFSPLTFHQERLLAAEWRPLVSFGITKIIVWTFPASLQRSSRGRSMTVGRGRGGVVQYCHLYNRRLIPVRVLHALRPEASADYLFLPTRHPGNQGKCRSGISRNKEIVKPAFNKTGETSSKCSQIWFSPLTFH